MSNFSFALLLMMVIIFPLSAFYNRNPFAPSDQIHTLDDELSRAVFKGNRWGYTFCPYDFPGISDSGLTYWIQATVLLKNRKFKSIDEAERLYVEIYKDFFRDVNAVRIIRPFLATFPLTPDSCRLVVGFDDEKGESLRPPYLASVIMEKNSTVLDNNSLKFMQHVDLKGVAGSPYEPICTRSVHDVPGLQELYNYSITRKPVEPKPQIPLYTELSWRHNSPDGKAEWEFVQKICTSNDLKIVILGCVGAHYHDTRHFDFSLRGSQCFQLDDARKLAAKCSKEFLDYARNDRRRLEYKGSTKAPDEHPSPTPIPEQLAFRISFWDENIDRQVAPNIAEIRLLDGKFKYFTADEGQRLELVYEETFDEAQAFLKAQTTKTE